MSKANSVSAGLIFMMFSPNGRYLHEFYQSGPVLPILQGTLPWQPILCRTGLFCSEPKCRDLLDRFLQSLHHMVGMELQMISPTFLLQYYKGRCHGNQFCGKITYPLHLLLWHSDTEWDITTTMSALST